MFIPSPPGAVAGGLKARHQDWAKRSKNLMKRSMSTIWFLPTSLKLLFACGAIVDCTILSLQ